MNLLKCKLKGCLSYEDGYCVASRIPPIGSKVKPNNKDCEYYDNNFHKSFKEVKEKGGVIAFLNGKKGKPILTDEELKEIKKSKRKPRTDKGKKRGRPKKND